jgi:hypothetical protein
MRAMTEIQENGDVEGYFQNETLKVNPTRLFHNNTN